MIFPPVIAAAGCREEAADGPVPIPEPRVHAFYYPWYGNPTVDGGWSHWK